MIRSFVAIDIPQLPDLKSLIERLKGSGSRLSVPRAEGVHVTLKFLGDVEDDAVGGISSALRDVCSRFSAFEARMAGTGVFPGAGNPRVFWVRIEDGGAMASIAKAVDESMTRLGFEAEKRPFAPHVTVARVKSPSGIERAYGILREYEKKDFGSFTIADIRLKKSTLTPGGSIYEDIGVIPLSSVGQNRK